jgi:hypothetical protein
MVVRVWSANSSNSACSSETPDSSSNTINAFWRLAVFSTAAIAS